MTRPDDRFDSSLDMESLERDYISNKRDGAFRYNAVIVFDREANSRVVNWDLEIQDRFSSAPNIDRTSELLAHLNADSDAVLSVIREHTDLRTTKIGSNLGWVIVDAGGDIIDFKLVEAYPGAPSVKIAHEELVEDLRALNSE